MKSKFLSATILLVSSGFILWESNAVSLGVIVDSKIVTTPGATSHQCLNSTTCANLGRGYCEGGVCKCRLEGGSCGSLYDCCERLTCNDGICRTPIPISTIDTIDSLVCSDESNYDICVNGSLPEVEVCITPGGGFLACTDVKN